MDAAATLTETRSAEQPAEATPDAPVAERLETRDWLMTRISREMALTVSISWYLLFMIGVALEPEPTHPDAMPAWIAVTVSVALFGLLAVMTAGLLARRRWGLVGSMAAATLFVAMSIACPVSGHHGFGAWWYGQMACALALVAISAGALRRA